MATLAGHMERLLQDPSFSDVVLVACSQADAVEKKEIPANSHMLARSPVLGRMFAGEFSEGAARRAEVLVPSARVLEQLVRFLYTDSLDFSSEGGEPWSVADSVDLLVLLDKYEAPGAASEVALRKLSGQLEQGDVETALQAAQRSVDAGMLQPVEDVIRKHLVRTARFGKGDMVRVLAWGLAQERLPGRARCQEAVRAGCLEKVTFDLEKLKEELQSAPEEAWEASVARSLVLARFVQLAGEAMQTRVSGVGSTQCGSTHECRRHLDSGVRCGQSHTCKAVVSVDFDEAVNLETRPGVAFGAERLLLEMQSLVGSQLLPSPAGAPPGASGAGAPEEEHCGLSAALQRERARAEAAERRVRELLAEADEAEAAEG